VETIAQLSVTLVQSSTLLSTSSSVTNTKLMQSTSGRAIQNYCFYRIFANDYTVSNSDVFQVRQNLAKQFYT